MVALRTGDRVKVYDHNNIYKGKGVVTETDVWFGQHHLTNYVRVRMVEIAKGNKEPLGFEPACRKRFLRKLVNVTSTHKSG